MSQLLSSILFFALVTPAAAADGDLHDAATRPIVINGKVSSGPTSRMGRTPSPTWPVPARHHPALAAIPPHAEASIADLGRWIATQERDPFQRVKLIHDWVTDRIRYDHASVSPGPRRPQDATSVFSSRLAVCEGVARLMIAIGQHTGDRFEYVVGVARDHRGAVDGTKHAWNVVDIEGRRFFVDATWDSPTGGGGRYRTDWSTEQVISRRPPRGPPAGRPPSLVTCYSHAPASVVALRAACLGRLGPPT